MATIRITFKDPDYAIDEWDGYSSEDLQNEIAKWLEWDEYVTIEIDTDANEARVIPAPQRRR